MTHVKSLSGTETVLVVEDDRMVRELAIKILQKYGYKVLEAKDGEEAIEIGKQHEGPIDLMLTDVADACLKIFEEKEFSLDIS